MSSSLVFLEVVVKLFDYIWKPYSLFSKFWVNCLLTFYFVHCNNCALKDVNGACYCTSSLVAPARAWNERLEKPRNFEMHTCHWPGAQLWFRHKWRKLVTASLLFQCIDGYSCLSNWKVFFSSCVSGFGLKISRIAFWRKRLQMDSKSHLTTNGLILGFFVGKWLPLLTSYLYGPKCARIAQLRFSFCDIKVFWCLVWGVFWSVL